MFKDRADAGRQLAAKLVAYRADAPIVIGLPRGGVPVAHVVARTLHAPLDVIVVRKLGTPGNPELGFGAISEEDVVVFNQEIVRSLGVDQSDIDRAIARERVTLNARLTELRSRYRQLDLKDRVVIVIDDGLATGIDARAACRVVRARGAKKIVLAVPVAPSDWTATMAREADVLIAADVDPTFMAVGSYYENFEQVSDAEVSACLESACLTP